MSERLPPERRLRLYSRLAKTFEEAGMKGAADAAHQQVADAIRESPEMQQMLRELLASARKEKS